MAYTFGVDFLDKEITSVTPGSNILLYGPPMVGKSVLARQFFHNSLLSGSGGIYITTKDTAGQLKDWFSANGMDLTPYEARIGIIDCLSKTLDFTVEERSANVIQVSSAVDLNGISIGLNRFLTKFFKELVLNKSCVVMESLSNLLMFSNLQTVYRFLYVFAGRIRASGGIGLYTLDAGLHSPETLATVRQVCQGVIEMNEDSDGKYLTATGLGAMNPRVKYNIQGGKIIKV